MSKPPKFSKISQWVQAGNFATGYVLIEKVARETEKAVGFKATKSNSYGNPYDTICWIPKSKIQMVENDFYQNGEKVMHLIPQWLYAARTKEGYDF